MNVSQSSSFITQKKGGLSMVSGYSSLLIFILKIPDFLIFFPFQGMDENNAPMILGSDQRALTTRQW